MSETTETATTEATVSNETTETPATAEEPNAKALDQQTEEQPNEQAKLSAEAKKYRLRLRDTEAALEEANNRLDAMRRAEVERVAQEAGVSVPSSLWSVGLNMDDLLDKEGNLPADLKNIIMQKATEAGLAQNPHKGVDPAQVADALNIPKSAPDFASHFAV